MLCLASVLAAPRTLGRASRPRRVGGVAAGMAQHGVPAGAQRPVHRPHRLRDVRHRRGRSVQARRIGDAARSSFGRWRISAAGRDAAADRSRSQRRGGARCDESAGRGRAAGRPLRSFSCAAWRRHELPESVSAEEPAHRRGDAGLHQQRAIRVPQLAGRVARRAREPVAAAQSRFRRRCRSRHHRRQLDDLRAAHEARRRLRAAGVVRAPDQAAARRGVVRQHFPGGAADGRAAVRAAVSRVGGLSLLPRRRAPRANTGADGTAGITIVGFRRRRGLDSRTARGLSPR